MIMKQGFFQAFGVSAYCFLIGLFMWNSGKVIPGPDNFLMPVAFLTLFSTSALVCALIVFYKPYKLFSDGKKKEAIETVVFTAVFLLVFAVLLLTGLVLFK